MTRVRSGLDLALAEAMPLRSISILAGLLISWTTATPAHANLSCERPLTEAKLEVHP